MWVAFELRRSTKEETKIYIYIYIYQDRGNQIVHGKCNHLSHITFSVCVSTETKPDRKSVV